MTEKRQFTPVQSRVEKYQTYRECMGRYSRAMRSGFFFEALLIDYAMIEDRLRSFLWHAGAFNRWEDKTAFCKKAASRELKALVEANWPGCPKAISLDKLSHKIGAVRAIAVWSSETPRNPDDSAYLNALRIDRARRYLRVTSWPIEEIAVACGFANLRTFDRVFAERCGCTPRDFRKAVAAFRQERARGEGE